MNIPTPPPVTLPAALKTDSRGLLPVITQCAETDKVLMLAWMNRTALEHTLAGGRMVYYSRSRQCLWRKGDSSGHTQQLVSIALDCDGDALLAKVIQRGPACHTGTPTCFHTPLAAPAAAPACPSPSSP